MEAKSRPENKKMNVLFLEPQPCIRALKYARGLKDLGDYSLKFGYLNKTLSEFYGEGDDLFDEWIHLEKEGVGDLIDLLNKNEFDLIHSHNAPDYLTVKAIDSMRYVNYTIPVIHDNHDLITMRKTPYGKKYRNIEKVIIEEKIANEFSDGVINVTQGLMDYTKERYFIKDKMEIVFPNFVPLKSVPKKLLPKLSLIEGGLHIVYQGNLDDERTGAHYDLVEIFDQIGKQGINLHIYSAREGESYKDLENQNKFIHFHGRLPPEELMIELTKYDFGWAGFNAEKNVLHLDAVLANKVLEYISAGIPVISFPHKTQKKFLESENLGIVISEVSELKKYLNGFGIEDIIESVNQNRFNFTLERRIKKIDKFYKDVVKRFNPQFNH